MLKNLFIIFLLIFFAGLSVFAVEDIELQNDAKRSFGILPEKIENKNNPTTSNKVKLGKKLFYDTRLSVDNTISCAKCHFFGLYAIDGLPKSIGNNYKEMKEMHLLFLMLLDRFLSTGLVTGLLWRNRQRNP